MDPVTISTGPAEHPILDYQALLRLGMAELERLAGGPWTDFNTHDPGITLLELICYALTDLGYRTFHPIPDLLAEAGPDTVLGLFSPAEALTTAAVTPDDLRRVVLDVPGVKNAWIERVDAPVPGLRYDPAAQTITIDDVQTPSIDSQAVNPAGLWRVLVEKSDLEDIDGSTLRRAVARRLHANRPLCEDFDDIIVLDPMPVAVYASVEIGETENGASVLLGILLRIAALISPAVGFLSLDQALAAGIDIDQAFEGPALARGFVDPATLPAAERRVALHTSDVIHEIMAVPGVRAVRTIRLARAGDPVGEPWSLTLDATGTASLDITASAIELVKDRLPVKVNIADVASAYAASSRQTRLFPVLPRASRDLVPPPGSARNVSAYLPLETDLPLIYGIGAGALPDTAGSERRAKANQLRGYLTLFDQLLANEYAQLSQLGSLFSAAEGTPRTYFGKLTRAADASASPILAPGFGETELADLVEPEGSTDALQRRNRLLNHLLARFAETITNDPLGTNAVAPDTPAALSTRLLDAKREFLRSVPRLGAMRGVGTDYLSSKAAPTLADRVRLRLGLSKDDTTTRILVVEHILLRALPEDAINAQPLLAAATRADPWSSQLSFVVPMVLHPLEMLIQRVMREETPAHLVAYIVWLEADPFNSFAAAYDDWLTALQRHWLADRLGTDPDAPTPESSPGATP
jgi:hypothetical protein